MCRGSSPEPRKNSQTQLFGAEARATGAGPFSRTQSWNQNRRDIKLGSRAGTRAKMLPWSQSRAVQNYPGSASLVLAMQCHPCGLESSGPIGALPAARRPPGKSVLWGCSHRQSGTKNTKGRSGDRSMDPKQWRNRHTSIQGMDLRHPCNHQKTLSLYKVPQKSGGRRTARRVLNIQESTKQLGMRRTTMTEIAPSKRGPAVGTLSERNHQKYTE